MPQRFVGIAACFVLLSSCGQSETTPSPTIASTEAEPPTAPQVAAVPAPNFVQEENGTYFYVTAVSEEDHKKGKAVGDVVGFRYIGKNNKAQHVLVSVSDSGQVISKSYCSEPCAIIKHSDGTRVPYDPNSIIGAAFQDAMNGLMKPTMDKATKKRRREE